MRQPQDLLLVMPGPFCHRAAHAEPDNQPGVPQPRRGPRRFQYGPAGTAGAFDEESIGVERCESRRTFILMSPNIPVTPPPAAKKSHWLLYGFATAVTLFLLIVATVIVTLWWIQRPIKPVVLSAPEKAVVEEKLQHLGGGNAPTAAPAAATAPTRSTTPASHPRAEAGAPPPRPLPSPERTRGTSRALRAGIQGAQIDRAGSQRVAERQHRPGEIRTAGVRPGRRQRLPGRAHPAGLSRRRRQNVPRARSLPCVAGQWRGAVCDPGGSSRSSG